MKKIDLSPLAPPGVNWAREVFWILVGLAIVSAVRLFSFQVLMYNEIDFAKQWLEEGAPRSSVHSFREVVSSALSWFFLVRVAMVGMLLHHIELHYRGSRSVYLMRRLPCRWEFFRRCAALPLAGVVGSYLVWGLLQLVLFWLYVTQTPQIHLPDIYRGGFFAALMRGGFLC